MPILNLEPELDVSATEVRVSADELSVELEDGRSVTVPIAWYPRLQHGTAKERQNFEVGSYGIHWPDLDEDISYRGILLGRKSGESSESLKFWLDARKKGKKVTLEDFMKWRKSVKNKPKR
jgi:hypothetical protein